MKGAQPKLKRKWVLSESLNNMYQSEKNNFEYRVRSLQSSITNNTREMSTQLNGAKIPHYLQEGLKIIP